MTGSYADAERLIALLSGRPIATETFDTAAWQRILELAQKHAVAPLLHSRLRARNLTPPIIIAQQLRDLFLANIKRNARMLSELGRILRAFQAAGISVIPLKGACLAEAVYSDVALRQIGDLDLLVKPADLSKALDVLNTLGYFAVEAFDIASECQLSQHMPTLSNSGGILLDLHWTIVSPWFDIPFDDNDLDRIWSQAMPVNLSGVQVSQLSPIDLLLYLCVHAAVQHRFDGIGLRSFWDMAMVMQRYGNALDWAQFTRRVNQLGVANGVHLALQLLQEWTDAIIPLSVLPALTSASPDYTTVEIIKVRILRGGTIPSKFSVAPEQERARISDILAAVRYALFPSRHVLSQEYRVPANSWRILFCYPIRIKDMWKRNPRALRQVLGRDKKLIEMQQELELRQYLD